MFRSHFLNPSHRCNLVRVIPILLKSRTLWNKEACSPDRPNLSCLPSLNRHGGWGQLHSQ